MKAEDRKKQILDCALKIFSKKGYYETHVEDIIKELKIAKGTIYQYFKNKEDIFVSILQHFYQKWKSDIAISRDQVKNNNPVDYFRLRVLNTLTFLSKEKEFSSIYLIIGPGLKEEIDPHIKRIESMITDLVVHDLNLALKLGHLSKNVNVKHTATMIIGTIHRIAYQNFIYKDNSDSIEDLTDNIVEIFSHGMINRS